MIALQEKVLIRARRRGSRPKPQLAKIRPSILDTNLDAEPWIDPCPCSNSLVLFLHNRPIAVIPGTALEYAGLTTQLFRLRHRTPRRKAVE